MVEQAMLRRNFGRGILRDAAAKAVFLHQEIICPALVQKIGRKDTGDPAADNQDIRIRVTVQPRK